MAAVVGVHGIAQQNSGPARQEKQWADAFTRGLSRANCPECEFPTLTVPFYGNLFRKGSSYLGGNASPHFERVKDEDWADGEIAFVSGALDELTADLSEAEMDAAWRASPTLGPPALIPPPLLRGLAAIDRRWGTGRGLLLVGVLRQVNGYLFIPETGERIRQIVTNEIGDDTRVLVGHSLGSVIVYDLLVRGAAPQIRGMVTLGSPLPLATVRSALPPPMAGVAVPGSELPWCNVYDPWDVVTAGQGLEPPASDVPVRNRPVDPHALSAYLARKETADAILAGVAR
jgi:hypothetical protein